MGGACCAKRSAPARTGHLCDGVEACDPTLYNASAYTQQWRRFVLRHRAQVLEVLTKYGDVVEASFDMNFPARPEHNLFAFRSLRRALLMPQVNTGSLCRCGKRENLRAACGVRQGGKGA